MHNVFKEEIENLLDKYKSAIDHRVCTEVDASCCRTNRDYENMHRAQDQEYDVREQVMNDLIKLFNNEMKFRQILNARKTELECSHKP